jgi:hypothetical protein
LSDQAGGIVGIHVPDGLPRLQRPGKNFSLQEGPLPLLPNEPAPKEPEEIKQLPEGEDPCKIWPNSCTGWSRAGEIFIKRTDL